MSDNRIPDTYDPLVGLLEDAADGARDHGTEVGLKQNDEAALRAVLLALVGRLAGPGNVPPAQPGLKALWNNAKAAKVTKTGLLRSAKSTGRAIAAACVGVLKPRLGTQWTNAWQNAGFTTGSLEMPDNPLTLLQQLRAYFVANPTHEKADLAPGIDATAAACANAAETISTASTASNQSNTDAGTAQTNLADGIKAARKRLTGLRDELNQLIGDDDERWYAFGFDKPADPDTPEVPENLVLTPAAAGSHGIFADWDDARRAESYRATARDAATKQTLATKLVQDSDATFANLPAGATVEVLVTALNATGESQPCAPVSVVVG